MNRSTHLVIPKGIIPDDNSLLNIIRSNQYLLNAEIRENELIDLAGPDFSDSINPNRNIEESFNNHIICTHNLLRKAKIQTFQDYILFNYLLEISINKICSISSIIEINLSPVIITSDTIVTKFIDDNGEYFSLEDIGDEKDFRKNWERVTKSPNYEIYKVDYIHHDE